MAVLGASSLQIDSATLGSQSGSAPMYACRAWVNFNGTTATPSTIRGNGNVSSVTRSANGDYTVNFTTAMPDANYAVTGSARYVPGARIFNGTHESVGPTTTQARINVTGGNGAYGSASFVHVAVFR
jgi:hypothetical protein